MIFLAQFTSMKMQIFPNGLIASAFLFCNEIDSIKNLQLIV